MTSAQPAPRTGELAALLDESSALLLDFNGTLSDDEELLCELVQKVLGEHFGVEVTREQYFTELVGHTEERMLRDLTGSGDAATVQRFVDLFNHDYLARIRAERRITLVAEAFVHEARRRGTRIAVVTAASTEIVVPALAQIGLLEAVDAVVALEDVEHSKPAPDCYLRSLDADHTVKSVATRAAACRLMTAPAVTCSGCEA